MKTLSIVIPVYNEEKRLSITFGEIKDSLFLDGFKLREIIFVDDGSTDKSQNLLIDNKNVLEKKSGAKVKIIFYKQNRGKGYAVKRGMLASTSDYTLLSDADISTPLSEIKKFKSFVGSDIQVVVGTRKNGKSTVEVAQPIYRQALGHVFTYLSQFILNTWITDFTCGFKLFERTAKDEIFSRAKIDRWGYDSEAIFLARKLGFSISEKAVIWSNKEGSRVNIIKDGLSSFGELIKIRYFDLSGKYEENLKLSYA